MILLSAAFVDNQLMLWGEVPPSTHLSRSRRERSGAVRRSPYDAGASVLNDALARSSAGFNEATATPCDNVIWVPSIPGGSPAASSPLIAPRPDQDQVVQLVPWLVTALPLTSAESIALLCAVMGKEVLAEGVLIGPTLAYWAAAMQLAGALAGREQFLPGLERDGAAFRSVWKPVISGPDLGRVSTFARAMPAACRAMAADAGGGGLSPPERTSREVLGDFLATALDTLVRASCRTAASHRPRSELAAGSESVHERWIAGLRSHDGIIAGDPAELTRLAEQIEEWRRPLVVSGSSPFRLTFRLEEPAGEQADGGGDQWHVRYLLQSIDDPSLLIPAETGWTARGRGSAVLKRSGFAPREYLLSSLGHACRVDSRIEESLKAPAPGGYCLDSAGAHDFLTKTAWMLDSAGFGVLLPAWWTRRGTKVRLAARASVRAPKLKSRAGLSLDTIVDFNWEVALGGEPLTAKELSMLASHKAPLVRLRGQWVEVNADEIQAALEFWKKKSEARTTVREVVRMALGAGQPPAGLDFDGVTAAGWVGDLVTRLKEGAALEELAPPPGLKADLRPYQSRGYSWLAFLKEWGLGACLADDMGLGKTVQVLALLERQREAGNGGPVLVVCPTSVVGNWKKEAEKFTPDLKVMVHHGSDRLKGAAFNKAAAKHAVVLSSYSLIHRDLELLGTAPWSGIVLDEAQNIKNPETRTARAVRGLTAGYRIALTGTPVENHVGDLWSIMEFLNPGFLGTQADFKRTFFIPIQAEQDTEASEALKRLTGPFILRRLKTDRSIISDLPEKMEMKVFCTLTREQASLYQAVVKDAEDQLADAEGIQRRGLVLATLMKLKQVCNHPAQFLGDRSAIPGRSGKLARITEMLEEALAEGDRALIFSQFTEMGEIIRDHLQSVFGQEALFLHGGTPKKHRDRMVERFQRGEGPRLFILSLKAGGTGLNLTAANHVFHYDRWWNPAVENQATDRAFRIGQRKNVQVHKFLCAGTLEERIDEMIENKRSIAARVVGAGEGWLTELSTGELRELFRLRADAVGD